MGGWSRDLAVQILGAMVAGIILGNLVSFPLWLGATAALAGIIAFAWTRGFSLLVTLFAVLAFATGQSRPKVVAPPRGIPFELRARVTEGLGKETCGLELAPQGWRVTCSRTSSTSRLVPGEVLTGRGVVLPFDFPHNPGLFDYNRYYYDRGYVGRLELHEVRSRAAPTFVGGLATLPQRVRQRLIELVEEHLPGEEGALMAGLLFSEKSGILPETRRAFQRSGIMHILAVSGLNVSIVAGVVMLLLAVLRVRGWAAVGAAALLILVYVTLAEFSASVVRAGLMFLFVAVGQCLERKTRPGRGLVIAAIVILAGAPRALFDPGFQLSFGATAGLVFFTNPVVNLLRSARWPRLLRQCFLLPAGVSVSAQIPTLPLVALHFHRLPLLSVVTNLVVVPLVGLALPMGLVFLVAAGASPQLGRIVAAAARPVLSLVLWSSDLVSRVPFASALVGRTDWLSIVAFWLAASLPFLRRPVIAARLLPFLSVLLFGLVAFRHFHSCPCPTTAFLDLGRGYDATIFLRPSGNALVVSSHLGRARIIEEFLDLYRVERTVFLLLGRADRRCLDELAAHRRVGATIRLEPNQALHYAGLRVQSLGVKDVIGCLVEAGDVRCGFVSVPELLWEAQPLLARAQILVGYESPPVVLDSTQSQGRLLVGSFQSKSSCARRLDPATDGGFLVETKLARTESGARGGDVRLLVKGLDDEHRFARGR